MLAFLELSRFSNIINFNTLRLQIYVSGICTFYFDTIALAYLYDLIPSTSSFLFFNFFFFSMARHFGPAITEADILSAKPELIIPSEEGSPLPLFAIFALALFN